MECGNFEELTNFLVACGLAPDGVHGCNEADVDAIREAHELDFLLPEYIEFLTTMGRGAGSFLRGSDVFFPTCIDNYEIATLLLKEDSEEFCRPITLPRGSIVLLVHQGYEFYSLQPSIDGQGTMFYYREGEGGFRDINCTLIEFLSRASETAARLHKNGATIDNRD